MSLFQPQVLQEYLRRQELSARAELAAAYEKYRAHFLNPAVQENIRRLKEEAYQEAFVYKNNHPQCAYVIT